MSYVRWAESVTDVASPEALFDFLDDQAALASHMGKPSMMMLGGRMSYALDDSAGRAVGSRISMRGSVLGLELTVDEVIVEHRPPVTKVWETLGRPDLLVIGAYRMGFEVHGSGGGSPATGIHQLRRSGNGGGQNYRPAPRAHLCTLVRHADGPGRHQQVPAVTNGRMPLSVSSRQS